MVEVRLADICGRYVMRRDDDEVFALYGAKVIDDPPGPSWNVAPRRQVRVVLEVASSRPAAGRLGWQAELLA